MRPLCSLLFLLLSCSLVEGLNDWPIIGLFAQPYSSNDPGCDGECQYIAASYVKNLESAGARVIPIDYYTSDQDADLLFSQLNGFFFPGGGAELSKAAQRIFDKTVEANDAGDYIPLWGTCMGFQWLLKAATHGSLVLDPSDGTQMDAYNYSIPLDFTDSASSSKLFSNAPASLYDIMAMENVTMNNHHYGIWTEHFEETDALSTFFDVLSTNKDRRGDEFVSTMEAFDYPIYGTQWHPEKNNYEWAKSSDGTPKEAINHSPQAVMVAQFMSDFFVEETRKSNHKFSNWTKEDELMIWNYAVTRTPSSSFLEKYYIKTFVSVQE